MLKLCVFSPIICKTINNVNQNLEIKLIRLIHKTFICNIKTRIKVNEYLLNRSTPASEILQNLTEEDSKELENIKVEHQFLLSKGALVPKQIHDKDYLELLCLSYNQKKKYFQFLAKKEFTQENEMIKKSANKVSLDNRKNEEFPLSESKNQFYPKYVNKTIKSLENNLLFQAISMKSQEIVFDLSFEDDMYRKEVRNLAKQLNYCYSINKSLMDPYQMVMANLKPESITRSDLTESFLSSVSQANCPFKTLEDMPMIVSDKHYLDLFTGRRIVYLSPDSTNFFREGEYDHEAVYVIGGIIDKSDNVPLTLSRARREGLEHRSFPIDRYVEWKNGCKSLTLDQAFNVLHRARESNGDWRSAILSSIPSRALVDNSVIKFNKAFDRNRRSR